MKKIITLSLILCLILTGCGRKSKEIIFPDWDSPIEETKTERGTKVKTGTIGDTSVALFKKTAELEESGNIMISPLSIYTTLSMAATFAKEKTHTELIRVLLKDGNIDTLNRYFWEYLKGVNTDKSIDEKQEREKAFNFLISNGVFITDKIKESPAEAWNAIMGNFRAEAITVDMENHGEDIINSWVHGKTLGKIDKVIEKTSSDDTAFIINSIYFKGDWASPFKTEATFKSEFTNIDGTKVNIDFMGKASDYEIGVTAIKDVGEIYCLFLPYSNPDYRFFAIIPSEENKFNDLLSKIEFAKIQELSDNAEYMRAEISIPKLSIAFERSIADIAKSLGLKTMFTTEADFGNLGIMDTDEPLYVNDILHKVVFDMDENGTEAAAVTAISMMRGMSIQSQPEIIIDFDRPFICGVIDSENRILFMGAIREF